VTGLCLPTSDLDLVICLPKVHRDAPAESPGDLEGLTSVPDSKIRQTWQQEFARKLSDESLGSGGNKGWVVRESINLIVQTVVPIITLVATPHPLSRSGAAASGRAAARPGTDDDVEDTPPPIRLDISFEGPSHHGLATNELVTSLVKEHPALRALVLVLKQFLYERGFDQAYTGGLSSYGLVLMVARFLQSHEHAYGAGAVGAEGSKEEGPTRGKTHKRSGSGGGVGSASSGTHDDNWGRLLRRFLRFYGCEFEPRSTGISVRSWSYPHRTGMSMSGAAGAYASSSFDTLHIEDPLNIHNNVGRNCFRIAQIQRAFADAFAALTTTSMPLDMPSTSTAITNTSTTGDGAVGIGAFNTTAAGQLQLRSFAQCSELSQMLQNSEGRSAQPTVESVMHNHQDNNAQHVLVGGDAV
jgi:DNA polymerase sigma